MGLAVAAPTFAADFVSTKPSTGFPLTFVEGSASYGLDIDRNGTIDFTISTTAGVPSNSSTSTGPFPPQVLIDGSNNTISTFNSYYAAGWSTLDLATASQAATLTPYLNNSRILAALAYTDPTLGLYTGFSTFDFNFQHSPVSYAYVQFQGSPAGPLILGYIAGVADTVNDPGSFTLLDFGVQAQAVILPEPASLALLPLALAGLAVMRRQRRQAASLGRETANAS